MLAVARAGFNADVERGVSSGIGGFGTVPLESGPKEDDTLRNPNTFFPNDANIPDDVGVWLVCSSTGCCSSLEPGRSSAWLRKVVCIDESERPRGRNPRCTNVAW